MPTVKRKRRVKSVTDELIHKSREAALAAVQIFNNPLVTFKSELFIVTAVIAWTYLLHAYYRKEKTEYRYFSVGESGRRKYHKTKSGAYKFWELERCLNEKSCPLDRDTCNNLRFLIEIRHEIEHQMTTRIDGTLSAKFQACVLNYNSYIKQFFGDECGIDKHLAFSLQFSAISKEQVAMLPAPGELPAHIQGFITRFEKGLSEDEYASPKFAYRVLFVQKTANRKGQADQVIEFVSADSELGEDLNKAYTVIKETEKPKYLPSQIVKAMQKEGYKHFKMHHHSDLWKAEDAKADGKGFGVLVGTTWYWYDKWLDVVREHCRSNGGDYK